MTRTEAERTDGGTSPAATTVTAAERPSSGDQVRAASNTAEDLSGPPPMDGTLEPWVDATQCRLPPDVLFDVLKNQRRRLVLQYLREADEPVRIGTLAEHIAAFENDVSPRGLNAQQRKRVYIGLYQCHLPKMADVDVIEFNQARGIIELGDYGEELYSFLDTGEVRRESLRPYLGLVFGAALAFLLATLFLPGWSGSLIVGGFLTGIVLLVSTGTHEE